MDRLREYFDVVLLLLLTALTVYLLLLALGRWLKRRVAMRFGVLFQLFSAIVALYVALMVATPTLSWRGAVGALAVFSSVVVAIELIQRVVWELYFEQKRGTVVPRLVRDVVALGILLATVLLILSVGYHIQIPGLLAGSGILALALALAAQELLGNVIAGCVLHFEKPFKVGDWLIFEGRHVEVMEMNWRSSRVRTIDDLWLDVPNSLISRQTIANLYYPVRRHAMRLELGIDCAEPPNRVKDALAHAAAGVKQVLADPSPQVYLKNFGDFAHLYEIRYWLEDHSPYSEVEDAVRTNIWYELRRHGIKIPYPTRTLYMAATPTEPAEAQREAARAPLRQHPLFQSLDETQQQRLLTGARLYRFGCGEKLIEQGKDGDSMFVLLKGAANVTIVHDGQAAHLATLHAGACIGEMSLLTGEKRFATVTATTDCEVAELNRAVLAELFRQRPAVLHEISELLARRKLEAEGVLASQALPASTQARQQEYTATFLTKLRSLFEI